MSEKKSRTSDKDRSEIVHSIQAGHVEINIRISTREQEPIVNKGAPPDDTLGRLGKAAPPDDTLGRLVQAKSPAPAPTPEPRTRINIDIET